MARLAEDNICGDLRLPLIVAPMCGVSTPTLAFAACTHGVVGSFPSHNPPNGNPADTLENWLTQMDQSLADYKRDHQNTIVAPYAVNLLVHPGNTRLQEDVSLCVKHKVPLVITAFGIKSAIVEAVHGYGGKVLHGVIDAKQAKKAVDAGVDGLVAIAKGAGGHGGAMNPIPLMKEIREFFDGFVTLSGGMTSGRDILVAQTMGADVAYMGTRFISTVESGASNEQKKMVCDAASSDIVNTAVITGIPANFLRQSVEKAGFDLSAPSHNGGMMAHAQSFDEEAKAWKYKFWSAGEGVTTVRDVPTVANLITRMVSEYREAVGDIASMAKALKIDALKL